MNQNSWEAAQRSSQFGIEINNQFYEQLRAATRAALDAEGLTLENLTTAGDIASADTAERKRLQEEHERAVKDEKISNSLFLTAAVSLLPRVEDSAYSDFGRSLKFKTTNRQEAYDILDSVTWFGNTPYWLIGYRYTDNSALFMPAAPVQEYCTSQLRKMFTYRNGGHDYPAVFLPFKDEIRYSIDDSLFTQDGNKPKLTLRHIPEDMRFAINMNNAYTYHPSRKDRKPFKKFATAEARLETMKQVDKVYDHREQAFVINSSAPKVFSLQDNHVRLEGSDGSYTSNMVSTELMNHYNVFDGLVRLMARFDKGAEYLTLMQRAKDGDIEAATMEQQGIPVLRSQQAVENYLRDRYKSYEILNPDEARAAEDKMWDERWRKMGFIKD